MQLSYLLPIEHNISMVLITYILLCKSSFQRKRFNVFHSLTVAGLELSRYDIQDTSRDWIQSFLNHRKQYFPAKEQISMKSEETCSIHQGSYLGPLQFFIYLNDLQDLC